MADSPCAERRSASTRQSCASAQRVLTDADGRYEFRRAAGRPIFGQRLENRRLSAGRYGQTQPGMSGKPVVLADNQTAGDIDIRLPRGAVITGRITDEFGDPVPSARVTLMRQQFRQGQRTLTPANNATTNDIGEYRLFGLAPGQYYVSAMPQPGGIVAGPAASGLWRARGAGSPERVCADVLSGNGRCRQPRRS